MPLCEGYQFLVVCHYDLSGLVEARLLRTLTSKVVARFLLKDIISCQSCFGKLVIDGGSENKADVDELEGRYCIKQVVVSAYPIQANRIMERGHKQIVDMFSKMSEGSRKNWVQNFLALLLVNRYTLHTYTGLTSYYLNCGSGPVLPIELEVSSWRILPWNLVISTADLLAI